jgi:hypothetical protein
MSRLDQIYTEMEKHADAVVKHGKKIKPLIDEARAISGEGGGGGEGGGEPGEETTVTTSDELTAALASGGTITAAPGTYAGNFVVGKPTHLTLTGATLRPSDQFEPTLAVRANDVQIIGGTIENGAPDRDAVIVGEFECTDADEQPHRVEFVNVTVQAGADGGHRAIVLHGADITVRECNVLNFWEANRDSQAVWIHNGPGPYTIIGNYLEASGEIILTGGASIKIPDCIPSDILIDGNTCFKPDAWKTQTPKPTVKNSIELKVGRRVVISNNVCDGNWDAGQDGTPIVITVRNQDGDNPWAIVDDVTITGNTTRRCPKGFGVSVLGSDDEHPSQQTQTLTVDHNLFEDSPNGIRILNGVATALQVFNNTIPKVKNNFLQFSDGRKPPVKSPFTFRDNVTPQGAYGISGDNTTPGTPTLDKYCAPVDFNGNYLEHHPAREIPVPGENTWFNEGELPLDPNTYKVTDGSGKGY